MTCHHTSVSAALCLAALTALLSGASAADVVIDFQALAHTGSGVRFVSDWQDQGFSLTSNIESDLKDTAFAAWGTDSPNFPGSTSLFANLLPSPNPAVITLERTDGSAFGAQGMSLAPVALGFAFPAAITFTGKLAQGGDVTQTVTVLSSMTLQPFSFDATFAGLTALQWNQSGTAPHQFDDIRLVTAAIPEPATVWSAVCGLLALAAWRSRTRSAQTELRRLA